MAAASLATRSGSTDRPRRLSHGQSRLSQNRTEGDRSARLGIVDDRRSARRFCLSRHELAGDPEAADELYGNALDIAAEQGAKRWELRAAVSLARLRRDQGRQAEAGDLLMPVY